MRILVYGAGALGCTLARDFFKAGKDVTLLARGKWAETIKTNGLCIKNYVLPVKSTVRVPVVTELASEDEYDVIFVAARYTQVATILDALRANKSKNVVFLGNNVQPEKLVTALPEKNVMFAFASSAGHREFEGEKYRKTCVKFFTLMCATGLGKVCASDHAMNAIEEMSTLNRDLKKLFEENGASYPVWKEMEKDAEKYLQK